MSTQIVRSLMRVNGNASPAIAFKRLVFPARAATRILFLKIDEVFWPMLKTFLLYLSFMPEDKVESINGKEILTTNIPMDQGIIDSLREFDRDAKS